MSSFLKLFCLLSLLGLHACYDPELARKLATLSYASYCNPSRIQQWNVGTFSNDYPDVTDIMVIESKNRDVLAYVSYSRNDNAVVVTFRGSQNLRNWITNMNSRLVTFRSSCNCKVHAGFNDAYNQVKPELLNTIQTHRNVHPGSKLVVTGHSLGGALATIMAADLYDLGIHVDLLQTIGSPRVGDQGFWNWFASKVQSGGFHYRITNHLDPVVHLPSQFKQFQHINQEIYYQGSSYKICSTAYGEDDSCAKKQPSSIFHVDDHNTYLGINSSVLVEECR